MEAESRTSSVRGDSPGNEGSRPVKENRGPGRWRWGLLAIALLFLALRAALPGWLTAWTNAELDRLGAYHGSVEDVDVRLWKGAYAVEGLTLEKRNSDIPDPLLRAPELQLGLSWNQLLRGRLVMTARLLRPEIHLVDDDELGDQTGASVDWRERLEALTPFEVDELVVRQGLIHFRNYTARPPVDVRLGDLEVLARGLTNDPREKGRSARFELRGRMEEQTVLTSDAVFDPLAPLRDFRFRVKVEDIELTRLNDLLRAYGNLDVKSGSGEFRMELESSQGELRGYAKPLFRDIQVFDWEQDIERQGDNPLRAAWEALAGGLENLLKNQRENQLATRVEIAGRIGDVETDPLQAIGGILVNAFVDAYEPRFEGLKDRSPASDGN